MTPLLRRMFLIVVLGGSLPRLAAAAPEEATEVWLLAKREPPAAYRGSNLPERREPASVVELTPVEQGEADAAPSDPLQGLLELHATLSGLLHPLGAWLVLSSPLWLMLLVPLALRRAHQRRRAAASQSGSSNARATKAARSSPAKPAAGKSGRAHRELPAGPQLKERPEHPLSLAHQVLLQPTGAGTSLYQQLLGLGADLGTVQALRTALREQLDATRWAAVVQDRRVEWLRPAGIQWAREVATARLVRWLSEHPLVKSKGLQVQRPALLQPEELGALTLTSADGLALDLPPEQQELIGRARQALAQVMAGEDAPLQLMLVAHRRQLAALNPPAPPPTERWSYPQWALFLLLSGSGALERITAAGLSQQQENDAFLDAIEEHTNLVGTPVGGEGCAACALELSNAGEVPGLGELLASVAGASFSASSVVLHLSKRTGDIRAGGVIRALVHLGQLIAPVLENQEAPAGKLLRANARWMLGETLLQAQAEAAAALVKELDKLSARDPLWRNEANLLPPDLALVELYRTRVEQLLWESQAAVGRLFDLLQKLAQGGTTSADQEVAHRRLGYAVAGLGIPLLQETSTELISACREVLAGVKSYTAES